jgi:hypothetical protein
MISEMHRFKGFQPLEGCANRHCQYQTGHDLWVKVNCVSVPFSGSILNYRMHSSGKPFIRVIFYANVPDRILKMLLNSYIWQKQ